MTAELPRPALADQALAAATSEPLRARALAQQVLASGAQFPLLDRWQAHQALGLAARTQMELEESLAHFADALSMAEGAGMANEATSTRFSRSMTYGLAGNHQVAIADIDAAINAWTGQQRAEAQAQKGMILAMFGRFDEALAVIAVTVRAFRRSGNILWEARARANRSQIYLQTGAVELAEREAKAARSLYLTLDHQTGVAYNDHRRAVLSGLRGDIPSALEGFERVAAEYRRLGIPREQAADAEVAILLAARLATDARTVATEALAKLGRTDNQPVVPELRLAIPQADLLVGDFEAARSAADDTCAWFGEHGFDTWAVLATHLSLTARFRGGERTPSLQAAATAAADSLGGRSCLTASLDAYLIAGQVAQVLGDRDTARALLSVAAAGRRVGGLATRLAGWHAQALVEILDGQPRVAARTLGVALKLVDEFREVVGATELRASAAGHARDLAELGLDLAFESQRPTEIFKWSERSRAAALLLPPVRPPKDRQLARTLARLRSTSIRMAQSPPGTRTVAVSSLERQQRRLEQEVRRLSHAARGTGDATATRPSATAVERSLHDAVYVQIVAHKGRLHAVVITPSALRAAALGAVDEVRNEMSAVRAALNHLTLRPGSRSTATMLASLEFGTRRLDELIFGPIGAHFGRRRLVISPPAELHALPWSMLPTALGRLVTVAPSAASWLRAAGQPPPRVPRCIVAAGPGLDHAETEVLEIAGLDRGCKALIGPEAKAAVVARALGGASLAHLACHGRFRADNPSFSSLQMFDGPLYVYDLERLRRPPHVIVLSACDSGQAAASAGEELRGLTSALLALGTQAVIASVLPVRDDATRALMVAVHVHLAAGADAATALVLAQTSARETNSPSALAAAGSFTCFGAGWPLNAP